MDCRSVVVPVESSAANLVLFSTALFRLFRWTWPRHVFTASTTTCCASLWSVRDIFHAAFGTVRITASPILLRVILRRTAVHFICLFLCYHLDSSKRHNDYLLLPSRHLLCLHANPPVMLHSLMTRPSQQYTAPISGVGRSAQERISIPGR